MCERRALQNIVITGDAPHAVKERRRGNAASVRHRSSGRRLKFTASGNVNVHDIHSTCENRPQAIVTVGSACAVDVGGERIVSTVGNGLLPAALVFGVSTTQDGYDITGTFGFYPGVSTNDGGSPNLQQGGGLGTNVAPATTGLDVHQVFMTLGDKQIGTFWLGRNLGLFGFDATINDMTRPGVGGPGTVSVIDTATQQVVETIAVGKRPWGVAIR